jgi:hypothetical protein
MSSPILTLAQQAGGEFPTFVVGVVLAALLVGGRWYADRRRDRRKSEALQQLVRRDPRLRPTVMPCGLTPDELAGAFAATPRGDRRSGVRYGVDGPLQVQIAGHEHQLECGAFQWWSEERTRTTGKNTSRTRHEERRTMVALVRLPTTVPTRIRISPESLLGKVGVTRGGEQLESAEFNRRFRVEGGDRTLTVQLLDADLQHLLLEGFRGRTVELRGDFLVLGGDPSHRDASLIGAVGALPAIRQDMQRLVAGVPTQFWRAIGADRGV